MKKNMSYLCLIIMVLGLFYFQASCHQSSRNLDQVQNQGEKQQDDDAVYFNGTDLTLTDLNPQISALMNKDIALTIQEPVMVTVVSDEKWTRDEVYHAYLLILDVNGLTAEASPEGRVRVVSKQSETLSFTDRFKTLVARPNGEMFKRVEAIIQALATEHSRLKIWPEGNVIVIRDRASKIDLLNELVSARIKPDSHKTSEEAKNESVPSEYRQKNTGGQQIQVIRISQADADVFASGNDTNFQDIRVVPYYVNGVEAGFKFLNIKRGSFFEKMGLRRMDILKSVNGRPMTLRDGLESFNALKADNEFVMEVERAGEIRFLKIEVY